MSRERLASAAEMLRKGGTLVSEPCSSCKGVQVRFGGKITCINCGKEEVLAEKAVQEVAAAEIKDLRGIVVAKINEVLPILRNEREIGRQAEIAKLIMTYLDILARVESKE